VTGVTTDMPQQRAVGAGGVNNLPRVGTEQQQRAVGAGDDRQRRHVRQYEEHDHQAPATSLRKHLLAQPGS